MLEKLISAISDQMGIDAATLSAETSFAADLHADSVDMADMLLRLEDEYGICFTNDDIRGIKTIGDVVKVLNSKH